LSFHKKKLCEFQKLISAPFNFFEKGTDGEASIPHKEKGVSTVLLLPPMSGGKGQFFRNYIQFFR
jgi:hypothetical protein